MGVRQKDSDLVRIQVALRSHLVTASQEGKWEMAPSALCIIISLSAPKCLKGLLCPARLSCSNSLQPHGLYPARLLCPWDSPGRNTGVGCHAFLWGNLPNPGMEPRSQVDSLPSEPWGKSKNTGVGTLPFSRGSSQPRNQARISCIAGRFFTSWAIREVQKLLLEIFSDLKIVSKF